jgi:hypothetical protein
MESKHLVELPDRAVAPGPGVGNERRRDRGVFPVSSSLGQLPADRSLHRPALPCARLSTRLSRTSWRTNTPGFCTAAPRGTGRSSSPHRYCLRLHGLLLRPSTARGRWPAAVALRLPGGVQLFASASDPSRPWCLSVLKGSKTGCHQAPRPRTSSRHAESLGAVADPAVPALQSTTAKLMPRNLTRACSGLATLAADAGG